MERTVFAIGLVLMLAFLALGGYGLVRYATLSSEYNANCVSMFPLRPTGDCANLTAQMGGAGDTAFFGGVVGLVGLIVAYIGATRESEA